MGWVEMWGKVRVGDEFRVGTVPGVVGRSACLQNVFPPAREAGPSLTLKERAACIRPQGGVRA